jgi:hypothetical protein
MARHGSDGDPRDPRPGRGGAPLEQRLDRWVSAGRQLVDGVAGARPGSRPPVRSGGLGRWLEDRVDWLLDDGDDWREPWQERDATTTGYAAPARTPSSQAPSSQAPVRRRGLEAISRRASRPAAPREASFPVGDGEWPDEASFTVPRWQRPAPEPPPRADAALEGPPSSPGGRPLPRSTRRRS